ncbi:Protein SLG1 [Ophidiomyces ophidiicola]|nr:Protein SLG1 [Ophidiomyces ophidiicola]KAI1957423.1 Protein SLG1 [Ophidiomyces ophidiicola]
MRSLVSAATFAASLLLCARFSTAEPIASAATPSTPPAPVTSLIDKGCYKSFGSLESQGTFKFQSRGYCRGICVPKGKPVMALWKGSECFCGDKLPASSQKTDNGQCQIKCIGYNLETCGGKDTYQVLLTGLEENVDAEDDKPTSTSTTPPMQTITKSGETVVVTAGTTDAPPSKKDDGPNKAGIAAGVVVGVLALASLAGGAFFYIKHKKRQEVMEEYRRNATISNFVAGGKSYSETSTSDSRLDPTLMSQRRQSNGSIADDQDFSRRILKVTNPDSSHY